MAGEDEDRGFRGLGRLGQAGQGGAGAGPPGAAGSAPGAPPPADPPSPPAPPEPPPAMPPGPPPPTGRAPPPRTPPGGTPPPGWGAPPPPKGMSGCLKVALVLLGLLIAGVLGLAALGRLFEPTPEERAARTRAEATRLATERAERDRLEACRATVGARPGSGDELVRHAGYGQHTIQVTAAGEDAVVKLRQDGRTAIAFYVRAGETGAVEDVPDGRYQVLFATGSGFSAGCVEFLRDQRVSADPAPVDFAPGIENGATYYQVLEYRLTRVADGNFVPATVGAEAFRE